MKCGELLPTIFFSDPCRSRLCPVRVLSGADEDPVQTGSGPAASLRRSCGCRPPLAAEEGRVSVPVKPEPPRTPVPVARGLRRGLCSSSAEAVLHRRTEPSQLAAEAAGTRRALWRPDCVPWGRVPTREGLLRCPMHTGSRVLFLRSRDHMRVTTQSWRELFLVYLFHDF